MLTVVKFRKIVPDRTNSYYNDEVANFQRWIYEFLKTMGVKKSNLTARPCNGYDEERQGQYIEFIDYFCDDRNFFKKALKLPEYRNGYRRPSKLSYKFIIKCARELNMEIKEKVIWYQ